MGETEQESPRACVEAPWSPSRLLYGTFCRHHPLPQPLGDAAVSRGAPGRKQLNRGKRPLGKCCQTDAPGQAGDNQHPPPTNLSFAALKPNPTEQTEEWAASSQHPVGFLETRPGSAGRAQQRAAPRDTEGTKQTAGRPSQPVCAAAVRKSGKEAETLKS